MVVVSHIGGHCTSKFSLPFSYCFILENLCQKLMSFLSKELLGLDKAPRSVFGEKNVNDTNSHKPGTDKVEVSVFSHTCCIWHPLNNYQLFTCQIVFQGLLLKPKREEVIPRKIVSSKHRSVPVRTPLNQKQKTPAESQKPKPPAVSPMLTCNCYMTDRVCNICLSRYTLLIKS